MSSMLTSLFRLTIPRSKATLAELPGPPPWFPLGNALRFLRRQPWEVCADLGKQYGPLFAIWIFSRPFVVLHDGGLVREVLDSQRDAFYKADPVRAFLPLTPGGCLFLANGQDWKQLREQHPANLVDEDSFLADQIPLVTQLVRQRAAAWITATASRPLDLTRSVQRLAFDAFALCLWGQPLSDHTYRDFNLMGDVGARRVAIPPLAALPPLWPPFYAARRRWAQTFTALIERARTDDAAGRSDLLHRSLPNSERLPADAYRVELATMFYGGVYSVTSAVVSTLYCLAGDPEFAQRVRDEVRAAMNGSTAFDRSVLENCCHLDAALRESLRLQPPVPVFLRNVNKQRPVTLGGYTLPPDTPVIITTWPLHRSAEHWPDAEAYRPQRWLSGVRDANPLGSDHFFPFGRGPRTCIGQAFGWLAMKLLLATLLSEADVEVTGRYRQAFYFGVMLPRGVEARLARGTTA